MYSSKPRVLDNRELSMSTDVMTGFQTNSFSNGRVVVNKVFVNLTALESDSSTNVNLPNAIDAVHGSAQLFSLLDNTKSSLISTLSIQFKPNDNISERNSVDIGMLLPSKGYFPIIHSSSHKNNISESDDWDPCFTPRHSDAISDIPSTHHIPHSICIQHANVLSGCMDKQIIGHFVNNLRNSTKFSSSFVAYAKSNFTRTQFRKCPNLGATQSFTVHYLVSIDIVGCVKEWIDYKW